MTKVSGEYIKYFYDATGRKLCQQVYTSASVLTKQTDYAGELFYENDTLKFINHEEGRVVMTGTTPEYQYHLKDHLGNVRVTFTAKVEVESPVATMETANESSERNEFLYYDEAVKVNFELFDHTNAGTTYYSTRLNGTAYERTGLAKSLSVMPGDVIKAEVYAKYLDTNTANWSTAITNLITSIANGTAATGTYIDGGAIGSTGGAINPFTSLLSKSSETGSAPKAYLNYIVFDRDYNVLDGGFARITEVAKENGTDVSHELLSKELVIKKPGYVYLYLSNDNVALGGSQVEVYFDDFNVEYTKSPVIQAQEYYPFGLTFNSYRGENSVFNKIKFQGQEHIDDLNLGWDSFKWRNHQPDIGRFFNVDPLANKYVYNSPYAFSENRVIDGRELEGLEWVNAKGQQIYDPKANDGKGGYTEHATNNDKHLGNSLQTTDTGKEQFKKLVESDHPIETKINFSSEVTYSDKSKGKVQFAKTDNEGYSEMDMSGGKKTVVSTVEKSTITINIESIDQLAKKGGTFGGTSVKGLSFDEVLGAVFGHEIEHTTNQNFTLSSTGKDAEEPAYQVSDEIIAEAKENDKK